MNQVPHINKLLAELENIASADWKNWGIPNATAADFVTWAQSRARHTIKEVLIEMTEANAEQEQPLISAEEARKLGAGKAEWRHVGGTWEVIGEVHPWFEGAQYRAIKQPELLDLSNIKVLVVILR